MDTIIFEKRVPRYNGDKEVGYYLMTYYLYQDGTWEVESEIMEEDDE